VTVSVVHVENNWKLVDLEYYRFMEAMTLGLMHWDVCECL